MRRKVESAKAPEAIGPYSQAIEARGARTLWLSGQIPLDRATGELVSGDIAAQTERVMENLRAVLAAAGAGFEHVVQTTDYVTTTENYAKTAAVRREIFKDRFPTATGVIVAGLLRDGALIEISAIAVLPDHSAPPPRSQGRAQGEGG